MKTKSCHAARWCVVSCALLIASGSLLKGDEPHPADVPRHIDATIQGAFDAERVLNLNTVLLEAAVVPSPLPGVNVKPADEVLRSHLGLAEGQGFVVTAVAEGSGAAKAGLVKNDVLLTVAGKEISDLEMFGQTLRESSDKAVILGVMHEGKKLSIEIRPEHMKIERLEGRLVSQADEPKYRLGVGLADADETLRSQLSLLGGEGLVVTSVQTDGPAAKAGVLVNDVLIRLDGKFLTSIDALSEQLQTIGDKSVSLEVLRRGKPATLTVTPEKKAPEQEFSVTLSQTNPNTPLYIYQSVPLQTYSANQLGFPVWNSSVYTVPDPNSLPGDPASRVANLLQQVKQLQASLEALEAAIKEQPQPAEAGEKKSDP